MNNKPDHKNVITIALREVFGPLIKLAQRLPAILAYSMAIAIAIIVAIMLRTVFTVEVVVLLSVIILAGLIAFIYNSRTGPGPDNQSTILLSVVVHRENDTTSFIPGAKVTLALPDPQIKHTGENGEAVFASIPSKYAGKKFEIKAIHPDYSKPSPQQFKIVHDAYVYLGLVPLGESIPPVPSQKSSLSAVPPKTYHHLIGRQAYFEKVMVALRDPERKIILLTGLGGIGKTALAREVVEQCLAEGLFEYVVWTSAKTEQFVGERVQKLSTNDFTFSTLIEDIARQVGQEEILRMSQENRKHAVEALLIAKSVLIVVDNLDTAYESEALVGNLYPILGKSKALCTSRHGLQNDQIYTLQLKGLSAEAGRDFLREEGRARNIEILVKTPESILNRIHKVTGGAPLAMKLVAGQISRRPLEDVLEALSKASSEEQDYAFYRYIYKGSWMMLDNEAQKALVSIAIFPPVTGGSVEDIKEIIGTDVSNFWAAIDLLVMLSLVDKIGLVGRERFALHPLTQYFVLSDIVKKWSKNDR
jgi:hypothetical protein